MRVLVLQCVCRSAFEAVPFRLWYRRRALGEVLSETVLQDSLAWSVCGIYTIYIYLGFRVVFKGIWCLFRVIKGYGKDM